MAYGSIGWQRKIGDQTVDQEISSHEQGGDEMLQQLTPLSIMTSRKHQHHSVSTQYIILFCSVSYCICFCICLRIYVFGMANYSDLFDSYMIILHVCQCSVCPVYVLCCSFISSGLIQLSCIKCIKYIGHNLSMMSHTMYISAVSIMIYV